MGTYYDEYKSKTKKSTDEQKAVLKTQQTKADQIALDRLNADNEVLEQSYGTRIDETNSSYDTALKTNEVQRVLNERQIERRMAEMGLTDSGLNRTQSTAVQLSYANQKGNLIADRQKAVETLAAAMRSQMAQNQLTYNESVANNELTYESGVADIDAKVDADAIMYESERIKSDNEAIAKKNTAKANLYGILGDQSKSQSEMTAAINSYALSYGLSDEEQAEFTRLANQTLTDAAASAFAKEAEKEENEKIDDKDLLYDEFEAIDDKVASGDLDEETAKTRKERRFKQYISKHGVDADFDFYKDLGYEHLYYEGWTFGDWYDYFKGYKQSNGKEKAMREYARINGLGYIPTEYAADVFTATQR